MLKSKVFMLAACASLMAFPVVNYAAATETATQFVKGTSITADVKARLLADPDIKSLHVSVKTDKGVVTLSGYVHTDDQKKKAEDLASAVDGVKSVNNKLVVKAAKVKK
jgi:hyperosmotically inducible periplasmic protein